MKGNASGGERARHSGDKANALIASACAFINREYVLPNNPPSGSHMFCFLLLCLS